MPQMSSPSQSMLSHVVQLPTAWCCYQSRCKRRLSSAQQETLPTEAASSLRLHNACALAFCHLVVCVCHIGVHVFLQQYIPSQSYVVLWFSMIWFKDWQSLQTVAACQGPTNAGPPCKLQQCQGSSSGISASSQVLTLLWSQLSSMLKSPLSWAHTVHPRRHSSAWRFGCGVLWAPA